MIAEKQIRNAIREILADKRFNQGEAKVGNCYQPLSDNIGIGYQFEDTRTLEGRIIRNDNRENWFIHIELQYNIGNIAGIDHSIVSRIDTGITTKIAGEAYGEIAQSLEQLSNLIRLAE